MSRALVLAVYYSGGGGGFTLRWPAWLLVRTKIGAILRYYEEKASAISVVCFIEKKRHTIRALNAKHNTYCDAYGYKPL